MPGIVCAGHWVLDYIKFIDNWPNRSEICTILSESISNGGAPFNVIVDIANLKIDIPTVGVGCIGNDKRGGKILAICREKSINIDFLHVLGGEETSYTDVMSLRSTGERTMFHYHGANDKFSLKHVPIAELSEKRFRLFYLGHLLLMAALEEVDAEFGIKARRLLHDVRRAGMDTVLDIATEHDFNRYQIVVIPCLSEVDHLVIDELEAQKMTRIDMRKSNSQILLDNIKHAGKVLLELGVKKNVVIHAPEGGYWIAKDGKAVWVSSFNVPKDQIASACGAGDAFCAGVLIGLHDNWDVERTLELANAMAAVTLTCWHNSNGIKPLHETLNQARKWNIQT